MRFQATLDVKLFRSTFTITNPAENESDLSVVGASREQEPHSGRRAEGGRGRTEGGGRRTEEKNNGPRTAPRMDRVRTDGHIQGGGRRTEEKEERTTDHGRHRWNVRQECRTHGHIQGGGRRTEDGGKKQRTTDGTDGMSDRSVGPTRLRAEDGGKRIADKFDNAQRSMDGALRESRSIASREQE